MGLGKIRFTGAQTAIPLDVARRQADINRRRGHPSVQPAATRPGSVLAVAGGGPSITQHLPTLKSWPGDIWAVNGTWLWAQEHGLEATFFTLCCGPGWADVFKGKTIPKGAKAIIAELCEPALFDLWQDGDVRTLDTLDAKWLAGSTTATGAWLLGPFSGFAHVVFFGCEGSYGARSHAHAHGTLDHPNRLVIRAGGVDYNTTPEFLMQAEGMAEVIRRFPAIYSERSGGLLSALVADPDYDLVAASRNIAESLVEDAA